jgi:peptidoglycan/LPS O-acetylase OafA/YrhL
MFITFVGTVFTAYLSYRFFEEPILLLRERLKLKKEG